MLFSLVLFGMAHCAILSIIFGEQSTWTTKASVSDVIWSIVSSPERMAPIVAEFMVLVVMVILRTSHVTLLQPLVYFHA